MKNRNIIITSLVAVCLVLCFAGCDDSETIKDEVPEEKPVINEQTTQKKLETKPVQSNKVKLVTTLGEITVELDLEKAPVTTKKFLDCVNAGFYDGTIFHRVINGFMIQGGGFTPDMQKKQNNAPVKNEANNGLKNLIGTLAMARTNDPHSATSQFFINHKDNAFLDYVADRNPGYAVFGKVIEGMDIVDKIAQVKTGTASGMQDVPVQPVVIESATVITE